jgi:hypothetical protein
MNLLPQQEKSALQREISMRLIIAAAFLVVALELVAVILLIPTYTIVRVQHDALVSGVAQLQQTISGKGSVEDELKNHAANIHNFLSDVGIARYAPSVLIGEILKVRPLGITTKTIAFSRKDQTGALQLSGAGATREGLLEYQKNIRELPFVAEAHYSESFITKKVDIAYNLTVTLK